MKKIKLNSGNYINSNYNNFYSNLKYFFIDKIMK